MQDGAVQNLHLPFRVTVCGIQELEGHAQGQVSHVLSILDPDMTEPEAFGAYGEHARLELRFHDVIEDAPGIEPPQPHHVEQILNFGRDILRDPERLRHVLVHCHMGISRSSASMTLLLAQAQPEVSARDVLRQVLAVREKAWPNLRILAFGERQLGRPGEFTRAAGEVYRLQLDRRPELKDFFIECGRAREVELAAAS
jgi:predicted protein tyrosine phosphatase